VGRSKEELRRIDKCRGERKGTEEELRGGEERRGEERCRPTNLMKPTQRKDGQQDRV